MTHLVDYGLELCEMIMPEFGTPKAGTQAIVILVRNDSGDRTAAGTGTATGPSFDVGMWIGTGPLKPEHELLDTEERGLVTETTGERRVSSLAVDETVELPGSGVDMTPEMVLEAGKLSRAEQNLIEQC